MIAKNRKNEKNWTPVHRTLDMFITEISILCMYKRISNNLNVPTNSKDMDTKTCVDV